MLKINFELQLVCHCLNLSSAFLGLVFSNQYNFFGFTSLYVLNGCMWDLVHSLVCSLTMVNQNKLTMQFILGTRIVYERSLLMHLRNSPMAQTPPKNLASIPESLVRGSDFIEPPKQNGHHDDLSPVKKGKLFCTYLIMLEFNNKLQFEDSYKVLKNMTTLKL